MHEIADDHFHADEDPAALEQIHPLWRHDRVVLRSVGIDIGSSTSHLIFSTLEMRRQSAALSSRFELVDRRIDYLSPIMLTPLLAGRSLDVSRLSEFFETAYREANLTTAQIDTGAVITTGDAARKDNAESVVRLISKQAGKFVCASAGPLLEAKMAAYGSGAVARSAQCTSGLTVLNIDIGGGTSKLALLGNGRVIDATAINVGARLVTFDDNEMLTAVEAGAEIAAEHRGIELKLGAPISEKVLLDLAAVLVDALFEVVARGELSDVTEALLIATPLKFSGDIDIIVLSGGVSEYFYRRNVPRFGDLGPLLARLLRQRLPKQLPRAVIERPSYGIRATVIGASQFTVQVSGNTLHIPKSNLLPLRDLQVVTVDLGGTPTTTAGIAAEIRFRLNSAEIDGFRPLALAMRWPHGPSYTELEALARGLAEATIQYRARGLPLIVVLDVDIARLVGSILSACIGGYENIICIDGIDLHDFDYIDLGEQHPDTGVVTVVIKSLIFTA